MGAFFVIFDFPIYNNVPVTSLIYKLFRGYLLLGLIIRQNYTGIIGMSSHNPRLFHIIGYGIILRKEAYGIHNTTLKEVC